MLATTDHYLMVVKTTYTTDKGEQASGFTTRMGGRGAVPRLLRLKPEDQARTHGARLTKGRFTWITESGQSERWVVAHCGKSSVIWNFTKVGGGAGCAAAAVTSGRLGHGWWSTPHIGGGGGGAWDGRGDWVLVVLYTRPGDMQVAQRSL